MPTLKKRAAAVRRSPAPRKAKVERITKAEVAFLTERSEAYRSSEEKWQRLSSPPEEDSWSVVEEHLLADGGASKTWKYFSK